MKHEFDLVLTDDGAKINLSTPDFKQDMLDVFGVPHAQHVEIQAHRPDWHKVRVRLVDDDCPLIYWKCKRLETGWIPFSPTMCEWVRENLFSMMDGPLTEVVVWMRFSG